MLLIIGLSGDNNTKHRYKKKLSPCLAHLIKLVLAIQSLVRLADCETISKISSDDSGAKYLDSAASNSNNKRLLVSPDVTDLQIIPELRAVKLTWTYEYSPLVQPTAFLIKYCELTSWNDEIKCRSSEAQVRHNNDVAAFLDTPTTSISSSYSDKQTKLGESNTIQTSDSVISSTPNSTKLPSNDNGDGTITTTDHYVNYNSHKNSTRPKHNHGQTRIIVVQKGESSSPDNNDRMIHDKQMLLGYYEAHIYDLRAQTNYTFSVQVLRSSNKNTHSNAIHEFNSSPNKNYNYSPRSPRPVARQLSDWRYDAETQTKSPAPDGELASAGSGSSQQMNLNHEATSSNEISDSHLPSINNQRSSMISVAAANNNGHQPMTGSMHRHKNNYTSRIETKAFGAEATRCLADVSEVIVNTGRFFGGRISVEDSQDPRCQLLGNRSSEQSSYLFRIDHELCRSKLVYILAFLVHRLGASKLQASKQTIVVNDGNHIETIVLVHENKDLLTHNTARFLVLCNFIQKSFTLKASVSLPKVNGVMSSNHHSGYHNNHHQQQQFSSAAGRLNSVAANITQLPGKPLPQSTTMFASASAPNSIVVEPNQIGQYKPADQLPVRLGSMPGFFRAARQPQGQRQQPLRVHQQSLMPSFGASEHPLNQLAGANPIQADSHLNTNGQQQFQSSLHDDKQYSNRLLSSASSPPQARNLALKSLTTNEVIDFTQTTLQQQQSQATASTGFSVLSESGENSRPNRTNQGDNLIPLRRSPDLRDPIARARSLSLTQGSKSYNLISADSIGAAASVPKGVVMAVPFQSVPPEPVQVQSQVLLIAPSEPGVSNREARQLLPNGVSLIRSASSLLRNQQTRQESSNNGSTDGDNVASRKRLLGAVNDDQPDARNGRHRNGSDQSQRSKLDTPESESSLPRGITRTLSKTPPIIDQGNEQLIVLTNNHRIVDNFPSLSAPPQATTPLKMPTIKTNNNLNMDSDYTIKYSGASDIDNYSYASTSSSMLASNNRNSTAISLAPGASYVSTTVAPASLEEAANNTSRSVERVDNKLSTGRSQTEDNNHRVEFGWTPSGATTEGGSSNTIGPVAFDSQSIYSRMGKSLASEEDIRSMSTPIETRASPDQHAQPSESGLDRQQQFSLAQNITSQLLKFSLKTLTNVARRTVELLVKGADKNNNQQLSNDNSSTNFMNLHKHPVNEADQFSQGDEDRDAIDDSNNYSEVKMSNADLNVEDDDYEDQAESINSKPPPTSLPANRIATKTISSPTSQSFGMTIGNNIINQTANFNHKNDNRNQQYQGQELFVKLKSQAGDELANADRLSQSSTKTSSSTFALSSAPGNDMVIKANDGQATMISNKLSGIETNIAKTNFTTRSSVAPSDTEPSTFNNDNKQRLLFIMTNQQDRPLNDGSPMEQKQHEQQLKTQISSSLSRTTINDHNGHNDNNNTHDHQHVDENEHNHHNDVSKTTTITTTQEPISVDKNYNNNEINIGITKSRTNLNGLVPQQPTTPSAPSSAASSSSAFSGDVNSNTAESKLHQIIASAYQEAAIGSFPVDTSHQANRKSAFSSHRASGSRAIKHPVADPSSDSDGFIVQPKKEIRNDESSGDNHRVAIDRQDAPRPSVESSDDKVADGRPFASSSPSASSRFNEVFEFREPVKGRSLIYWPILSLMLIACVASAFVLTIWFVSFRHSHFSAAFNDNNMPVDRRRRHLDGKKRADRKACNGDAVPGPISMHKDDSIIGNPLGNNFKHNSCRTKGQLSAHTNSSNDNNKNTATNNSVTNDKNSKLILEDKGDKNIDTNNNNLADNSYNEDKIYTTSKLLMKRLASAQGLSRLRPASFPYREPTGQDEQSRLSFDNNRSDSRSIIPSPGDAYLHPDQELEKLHQNYDDPSQQLAGRREQERQRTHVQADDLLVSSVMKGHKSTRTRPRSHCSSHSDTTLSTSRGSFSQTSLSNGSSNLIGYTTNTSENVYRENNEFIYTEHVLVNLGSHRGESYA